MTQNLPQDAEFPHISAVNKTITGAQEFPRTTNSHHIDTFMKCPQRWAYEHLWRLGPTDINHDLKAGGCFAHGMDIVRQALASGATLAEALHQGTWAMFLDWGEDTTPPTNKKTLEAMAGALDEYFRIWPPDQDPLVPVRITDAPAIEVRLTAFLEDIEHPTTGMPLVYNVRLDAYVQDPNSGLAGPLDDKTTSAMGPDWPDQWRLSNQMMGYQWVLEQNSLPVQMIWVRGIAIGVRGYKTASVEMPRFPQWQMDTWLQNTKSILKRMLEQWRAGTFERAYSWQCRGCPFFALCTSRTPEAFLNNYRVRERTTPEAW